MKLKNLKPISANIFSYLFLIIIFFSIYSKKEKVDYPPPTEIIERKKDRKVFKEQRKEWMKAMHRSEPGLDWKKINTETRKEKFFEKTKNKLSNIQSQEYLWVSKYQKYYLVETIQKLMNGKKIIDFKKNLP